MRTNALQMTVRFALACLTIFQFQTGRAQSADQRRQSMQAPQRQDEKVEDVALMRRNHARLSKANSRGWLTGDQTLLSPVPKGGMFIASAALTGAATQMEVTGRYWGYNLNLKQSGSSFGPNLGLRYGFTDHFYVSTIAYYTPGRSQTETSIDTLGKSTSTSTDDGWREPQLALGASTKVSSSTRITGELSGTIPVGNSRSETNGNDTKSNGLSGGGSIEPRVTAVTNISNVKLIGNLSYTFAFDRKLEKVDNTGTTTTTSSGGNNFNAVAALEFPRAYNFGIGALYSRFETSSSSSSDSSPTSPTAATQSAGGVAYMGLPISDANMILAPRVAYIAPLNRNIDSLSINRYDAWILGLQGFLHF